MAMAGLTDEDVQNVTGGSAYLDCLDSAGSIAQACKANCDKQPLAEQSQCMTKCQDEYLERLEFCKTLE